MGEKGYKTGVTTEVSPGWRRTAALIKEIQKSTGFDSQQSLHDEVVHIYPCAFDTFKDYLKPRREPPGTDLLFSVLAKAFAAKWPDASERQSKEKKYLTQLHAVFAGFPARGAASQIDLQRTGPEVLGRQLDHIETKLSILPDDIVQKLVTALDARNKAGPSDRTSIAHDTIIKLARRLKPEDILDFDQAVLELEAAVDLATKIIEGTRHKSNLGDLVDSVSKEVAKRTKASDLEGAARAVEEGLNEWRREHAEQAAISRRTGVALLEAGLEQDILQRDAVGASRRVVEIATLSEPNDRTAWFNVLGGHYHDCFTLAHDKGVNFYFEVAIEIGRRGFEAARDSYWRGVTQNDIGIALWGIGRRMQGIKRLREATAALNKALKERPRKKVPHEWAATQYNLGLVYTEIFQRAKVIDDRDQAVEALNRSIKAFRASLYVIKPDSDQEVEIRRNLYGELGELGMYKDDPVSIREGLDGLLNLIESRIFTKDQISLAKLKASMGKVLMYLFAHEGRLSTLHSAELCYRDALEAYSPERMNKPLDWARLQYNLADVLVLIGQIETRIDVLEQAIDGYNLALEELTEERTPLENSVVRAELNSAKEKLSELRNREQ